MITLRRVSFTLVSFIGVAALAVGSPLLAQTGTIAGRVTVQGTARPVSAAQIVVVGTPLGTQTNDAGEYRLTAVAAGRHEIRVQRIGYAPATGTVAVAAGETVTLNLELRDSPVSLEQVVVTATGEMRKKEVAHTVSTISGSEIENAPVQNVQQLITGRSPGVTVLANSGQPGSGGTIRLRGNNSVSQGNNPIIYVDGVRIFSGRTPTVPNARQSTLPLNDIPAEDIERVEIVKGAAATTLYGTEASGGVIQIFTKRGRSGAPQWSMEAVAGRNDLESMGPDGDPTGLFVKQCRGPGLVGLEISTTSARFGEDVVFEDPTCPASGSWLRTGMIQRYATSVRGGSSTMSYFLSGNFQEEEGAIPASENKDGGFRGNFSFFPTQKLEITVNSAFTKRNLSWVPDGNLANGFLLNVGRGPNGNFKGGGCSATANVCLANAEIFKLTTDTRTDHFISGFTINYIPFAALTNRLTVGYDYNNSENESIIAFGHLRNPLGQIIVGDWKRRFLSVDYASTWNYEFRPALASNFSWGAQVFQDNLEQTTAQGDEFSGPGKPTLTTAARRTVTTDNRTREVNAGFFFQEQLGWQDRLFVTAGVRIDGNSSFGDDFGLQTYPKLGVAYTLSEHGFWPAQWWETLKLRAAVGESGKAPGAFDAARTWTAIAGDEAKPGFTPNQLGNPSLGPERTREIELGFESSALEGRLAVDFTYFITRTLDALIQVRYPPSQGFLDRQLENVGEIENRGIEAVVDAGLLQLPKFDVRARVNFTSIDSKATDLGGEPEISIGDRTAVRLGRPVPSFFATKVLNPDAFAEPILTDSAVYVGSTFPEKIIGLGSTITFLENFRFDALGEFQRGGHNMNYIGYQNALRGVWLACIPVQRKIIAAMEGDASALNDVKAIDRARCAVDRTKQNSDYWLESTDFFKLRNVSLTYTLPSRWLPRVRTASVTLAGRNLWTSTDYSGLDPESADLADNTFARREYYQLPSLRTFTTSVRLSF
jgi:TonB-dependent starch-binding outer membrane protein SusC